ncbi:MAG: GtrA family protein [Rhizobiaceae bacterium]|nr:GtrA family protein [Rhizobiaceae bacterium]
MTGQLQALLRRRWARFIVVGAGANLLLFVLVYVFHRLGVSAFPAAVVAYAVAFAGAYLAQRGWTFGGTHRHGRAFPRYLAAQLACAGLAGAVGHACDALLGAPPMLMAAAVAATAGAASYMLSSFWVFPSAPGEASSAAAR